jgi:hypothetical protein
MFSGRSWDVGVIHGHNAGRLTVHENVDALGKHVVFAFQLFWHPVRGEPLFVCERDTLEAAKAEGDREYTWRAACAVPKGKGPWGDAGT